MLRVLGIALSVAFLSYPSRCELCHGSALTRGVLVLHAVALWIDPDEAAKEKLEIAFVWNRTVAKIEEDGLVPPGLICENLGTARHLPLLCVNPACAHTTHILRRGFRAVQGRHHR